jgi:hypothetical protein
MLKNIAKIVIGAAIAVGILGCGQHTLTQQQSLLDQNWGRSFEAAKTNQILNPEAATRVEPVEGLEGPAAERAIKNHLSGKAPKQDFSSGFGVGVSK